MSVIDTHSDIELWSPKAQTLVTENLHAPDRSRVQSLSRHFFEDHNPYIRSIVRRTRDYLENTLDPLTNEPYLKPVEAVLFGEGMGDAVSFRGFLKDAYEVAEEFCD